ncbi:MAG TPA: ABC transporter permease [Solirubrobacteraceae bacterium]|nr:ABC transporter permease [Solirubrobacteraceae bacterium]
MLRLALWTVRARRASLAGAFIAVLLAVALTTACAVLMASALQAPGPGPFAAADAVITAHSKIYIGYAADQNTGVFPAPRLPATTVARASGVPGVARAIGDISFPVVVFDSAGRTGEGNSWGHGWSSASLAPYRVSGTPPVTAHQAVIASSLATALGVTQGGLVRVSTPSGLRAFQVTGIASGPAQDEHPVFFADAVASTLAGAPGWVNSVAIIARPGVDLARLQATLSHDIGGGVVVLDRANAAQADPGSQVAADRSDLTGSLGVMGAAAAMTALFVISSTFAFAVAHRRRETAAMRALGATPGQVRRLIVGEAVLVGLVGGAVGMVAGIPLAGWIAKLLVQHGAAAKGFTAHVTVAALLIALFIGLLVCVVAVLAAAWRASRVPAADALREQRAGYQRIGVVRGLAGVTCIAGGVAMIKVFKGTSALVFAFPTAMWFLCGVALLEPLVLGGPAALLAQPLRLLHGAQGLLASTAMSANRARAGAIAMPIVLITALVGAGVVFEQTNVRFTQHVTAKRVTAPRVLIASSGAGLAPSTVMAIRALPGVRGVTGELDTQVFLLDKGLTNNGDPRPAAGLDGGQPGATPGLDLSVRAGSLTRVHGDTIAIAYSVAAPAHLHLGQLLHASMIDLSRVTLRIGAIYTNAAGLGDVVMDPSLAQAHTTDKLDNAIYVTGGSAADRSLARYTRLHPEVAVQSRAQFLADVHGTTVNASWVAWIIAGLAAAFAVLGLVNMIAMATAVRGRELASIRLLGGTSGQCLGIVTLETVITVLVGLAVGIVIVRVSLLSVPIGPTGMPVTGFSRLAILALAGTGLLGIVAGTLAGLGALRAPPASAVRVLA